jgi:flagellar basal-body rod modification protein FlgD
MVAVSSTAAYNSTTTSGATSTSNSTLAGNFQTFLTLLTTQLQNQNPLDPLDTNQFTQQLVQFAQVEQQLKSNEQLASILALEKSTQATTALAYVGMTAVVDGSTAPLSNNVASWSFTSDKAASATITIQNSTGQTVYTGNFNVTDGTSNFVWDGKGSDGVQWPDGDYKLSIVAKDSSGQPVSVTTEVRGVVDAADMTSTPVMLMIGGQKYTVDQIKRVVRPSFT